MVKENIRINSNDGKNKLNVVKWSSEDKEPIMILQIVHGMVEYIERYDEFASFLADRGIVVVGHDHLGHGDTVKGKEDYGYFAEKDPSDVLIRDIHSVRNKFAEEYSNLPYFILGHSMGSYLLRKYLRDHSDGLRGAIIMGTGYIPKITSLFGKMLANVLALFFGWRHEGKLLRDISYSKPYKKYALFGEDLKNSWLTKDEKIVEKYYSDERCTFIFSLNGYRGLVDSVMAACSKKTMEKYNKDLPLMLVSGKEDPVGDLGKGVEKVYKMLCDVGIKDITFKLYEDDRHEILNELDREQVYEDIYKWLISKK